MSTGRRAAVMRAICLAIALNFISSVAAQGTSLDGESCVSDSDCYGGKKCLGGRCCAFTVEQYEAEGYMMGDNVFAGCTACSAPGDREMTWEGYNDSLTAGTCKSCGGGTSLISHTLRYENYTLEGFGTMRSISPGRAGRCAVPCEEDEVGYHDYSFYCEPKTSAGDWCDGSRDSPLCASGLCGYQYCCAQSECSTGICAQGTGECVSQVMVGESCVSDSDCYGGKKCLGGRCCAFTVEQYEAEGYMMGDNVFAGCTACSAPGDREMTWEGYNDSLTAGTCKSCGGGTSLISHTLRYENYTLEGFGTMRSISPGRAGRCAVPCEEDEVGYHDYSFYCEPKTSAGDWCDGSRDSPLCASGLCGYQYCCDEDAAWLLHWNSGSHSCCSICEQGSGKCLNPENCLNAAPPRPPSPPPPPPPPLPPPAPTSPAGGLYQWGAPPPPAPPRQLVFDDESGAERASANAIAFAFAYAGAAAVVLAL